MSLSLSLSVCGCVYDARLISITAVEAFAAANGRHEKLVNIK